MNTLLSYNMKVALSGAIFFIVYRLFFYNDTLFVRNRIYLLLSVVIMIVAPFLTIPLVTKTVFLFEFPNTVQINILSDNLSPHYTRLQIIKNSLLAIYFTGILIMLSRITIAFIKIISMLRKAKKEKHDKFKVAITSQSNTPFSIGHWLIIPEKYTTHQQLEKIVRHEMIHCRQYHSVDLFLAEMLVIVQWFNPFAWLLKASIIQNNEYCVDKQLLEEGVERQTYQYLLLQTTICKPNLAMGNYFSAHLLKKRIHMMNKSDSPKWYGVKNMMILVAVLMVLALGTYIERNMHTNVIASTNTAPTPVTEKEGPIYIRDGKIISLIEMRNIDKSTIQSVRYLDGEAATKLYGEKYKNGVVIYQIKPLSPLLPK